MTAAASTTASGTIEAMPDLLVILIVVLIVVLIWRGPKNLPEIGRVLGRGVRAARDEAKHIRKGDGDADKP